MRRNKDKQILLRIIDYCFKIESVSSERFYTRSKFEDDDLARDAVSFYVFQIGELSGSLSEELRDQNHEVPWRSIKGIRNIIAHAYEEVDRDILWDTIKEDIPILKTNCQEIASKLE